MLARHSLAYFFARGIPGIISFLSIAVYTRILNTDEYGKYVLTVAVVGLSTILFQWIRLSLLRYYPEYKERPKRLLTVVLTSYIFTSFIIGILGLISLFLVKIHELKILIIISIVLLCVRAWYEINLELIRSGLNPKLYGILRFTKGFLAISFGIPLVYFGLSYYAPLIGLIIGMSISGIVLTYKLWKGTFFTIRLINTELAKKLLIYGLPLTASFALAFIINVSDRLLIGWILDESRVGLYSAGYDIAQQTITLVMSIINLAAYPLAVRALEDRGKEGAYIQLEQNFSYLMIFAVPATIGLVLLSPEISKIFLGGAFQDAGKVVIPWIAFAVALSGIRSYHFDLAFQLGNRTSGQVWVLAWAAILNLILNLLLIPKFGIIGAAYSTVSSFIIAIIISINLGRKSFNIPVLPNEWQKILIASIIMAIFITFIKFDNIYLHLISNILIGGIIYVTILYLLDYSELRIKINRIFS